MRLGGRSSALGDRVAKPQDDRQGGSVTAGAGRDHRSGPSAGAAAGEIDWGFLDRRFCQRVRAGSGPARPVDPAGGGAASRQRR